MERCVIWYFPRRLPNVFSTSSLASEWIVKLKAWLIVALVLSGCAKEEQKPYIFLPQVLNLQGEDLEVRRAQQCQGVNIALDDANLTPENFRSVFNCANYDRTLEPLSSLVNNQEFPDFVSHLNVILRSDSSRSLKDTLQDWLEAGPEGTSRADRLLPTLASIIKNPAFQEGLPVMSRMLSGGAEIWDRVLPSLANLVFQERYPNNLEDIGQLFGSSCEKTNTARTIKDWAAFLQSDLGDQKVALRGLEFLDSIRDLGAPAGSRSIPEFLDRANESGVFVSMLRVTGNARGEKLSEKLNSQADEEEKKSGKSLNPEQRRLKAKRALFTPGKDGKQAPITQLAGLVNEFQNPHPDFVPALERWFSDNGPKLMERLSEYVFGAKLQPGLSDINLGDYLGEYADEKEIDTTDDVNADEFVEFLGKALQDAKLATWLGPVLEEINGPRLGVRNAALLSASPLAARLANFYAQPAMAAFGRTLIPAGKTASLSSSIRKFANSYRDKLSLEFEGKMGTGADHLLAVWWKVSKETLGENVVANFALELVQNLIKEVAKDFGKNGRTISEWYYFSPYSDPGSMETLLGYGVVQLNALDSYYKHREYLLGELAEEIFPDENDRRAFRLLVEQVPNIWLYFKSGTSRAGNDLTRALAEKDRGTLIRGYVSLIADAYRTGLIEKGVQLVDAYLRFFPESAPAANAEDPSVAEIRVDAKATEAMTRVLRLLLAPEVGKDYETSTLSRLLIPFGELVNSAESRAQTGKFVLAGAKELGTASEEQLNKFFGSFETTSDAKLRERHDSLRSIAETLRDGRFPKMVRQLNIFLHDNALKPALDFLARKIDDGGLKNILLFLRRVLGFKG